MSRDTEVAATRGEVNRLADEMVTSMRNTHPLMRPHAIRIAAVYAKKIKEAVNETKDEGQD